MAKKKKKAEKTCNIRIFCDIYYRYCSEFQENTIDFTVDNILTAAVDSDSKEVYGVVNNMKDSSTFSRILSGKRAITGLVWDFYDSPGAIDVIHGKLTKAFRYIPYKSQAAFCLTLFDAIYETRVVSSLGLDYLYELMKEDEYSFVCEALLFFATTMEPSRWKETLRAENRTYSARVINCSLAYNSDFLGRDDVFAKIEKAFGGAYIISLTGIIGVGKTQVALMYAHKSIQAYDYILWVNANSEKAVISDYAKILHFFHSLKDSNFEAINENTIRGEFHKLTSQTNNWLIIYDGFSGDYSLADFIPEAPSNGKILITTRVKGAIPGVKEIEVERLTVDNSLLFLDPGIKSKTQQEIDGAKNLIYTLGNLPLALSHAKHYLSINASDTYETYLGLLNEYGTELLDRFNPDANPEATLRRSVLAMFDVLEKQVPNAAFFLRICSFLSSNYPIELGMFETYAKNNKCLFPKELRRIIRDKLSFKELLYPLLRYSICNSVTFSSPCYWANEPNDTCIIINKLTLDVIRSVSESLEYFEIANDMIYRTAPIAAHRQAKDVLYAIKNWKDDPKCVYMARPYSCILFQNIKNMDLTQLDEESLFKILISLVDLPPYFHTAEIHNWIKTSLIQALSVKCESFIGCSIYNMILLIYPIFENCTKEDIKNKLLQLRDMFNLIVSRIHIRDRSAIDIFNNYFEMFLATLSENPSPDDADIKMLEKIVEWGEKNAQQQKTYFVIESIDKLSEMTENEFLSNYLIKEYRGVIDNCQSFNTETCEMDELYSWWGMIKKLENNPDFNMAESYSCIANALEGYRKKNGLNIILPSSFKEIMKTYYQYMYFILGPIDLDIPDIDNSFIAERYDFDDDWAKNEQKLRINTRFLIDDFCKLLDISNKATEYYLRYIEIINAIRSILS